jgi:hypothetical protein
VARPAKSIARLDSEIEAAYPGTTTWIVGDEAHKNTWSDHNANDAGVYCAIDVKGDGGLELAAFVRHLIAKPHPNLRYVIFNHKIYHRSNDFEPEDYHGKSGHEDHAHASVGNGPDGRSTTGYDNGTTSWRISAIDDNAPTPSKPSKPSKPSTGTKLGDKMPTIERGNKGSRVRMLQGLLLAWGYSLKVDGIFGAATQRAVRDFQSKHAKPVDGIVGAITWNALLGLK